MPPEQKERSVSVESQEMENPELDIPEGRMNIMEYMKEQDIAL